MVPQQNAGVGVVTIQKPLNELNVKYVWSGLTKYVLVEKQCQLLMSSNNHWAWLQTCPTNQVFMSFSIAGILAVEGHSYLWK